MLRHKDNTIISEIKDFFTSSEKAMDTILGIIRSLTFSEKAFGFPQACNQKYSNFSKLLLLLLFPVLETKSPCHYSSSSLYNLLACGKDVFYRLLNNAQINWRKLSCSLTLQLIRKTQKSADTDTANPRCLIIDDTDLPKTGRRMELIGRIFSHVTYSSLLGFKGLFMGYHDGKSFFSVDFSLHGEKGKNEKKPYGLTRSQAKERYSKKRKKSHPGAKRVNEYFSTKIASAINMIRLAIEKGIRFDYLLVDSWFTCLELVKFIATRRIGCHFLGMIKMGTTKYFAFDKELTAKEIVDTLRRKKKQKYSKLLKCYYMEIIVDFKGVQVKLFFCKMSKKGAWNGLMTTNSELSFEQAYKIYSTRWSTEVFFKETKQFLGLGKCQAQDFDAQIAATTLCMLQYNILSVAKRFGDYETFGEMFRASQRDTLKLTIAEQIWLIITEIAAELSELFDIDMEMLMEKIVTENEKIAKYFNLKYLMKTG
jgi:Transposase DDE domain.